MKDVAAILPSIPEIIHATEIVPITKGWSSDLKYRVEFEDGTAWMLRLSDACFHKKKGFEYECLRRLERARIPAPQPVGFGTCNSGIQDYMLLGWVNGRDLRNALVTASVSDQYALGLKAGRLLKRLQGIAPIPAPKTWEQMFLDQLEKRKCALDQTGITLPARDAFLACADCSRDLLADRPLGFAHGDYHVGNLLVTPEGEVAAIDFDRCRTADPWDDHKRVVWDVETSSAFARGRLDGYFEGEIPNEFWQLLAAYCASNAIGSIPWAVPFGKDQVELHLRQAKELFEAYDGMERIVPRWYSSCGDATCEVVSEVS